MSSAPGQQPAPPVGALDHTVWTIREGGPSSIQALTQAADGTLWIGSASGLYRFDGVRFELFAPARPLPSLAVSALLAPADGTLWIGHALGGVSVVAGGRVASYGRGEGVPEGTVTDFARDSAGGTWVATTTGIARLEGGRWRSFGPESGFPGGMTSDLLVDRRGELWASAAAGVFVLPRGARRFSLRAPSLAPGGEGVGVAAEAPDGSIWGASLAAGLTQLSDAAGRAAPVRPPAGAPPQATSLTVDRRGNAWVSTLTGLFRVATGGAMRVEQAPVTSTPTTSPMEDREGNVWVGTPLGLERFRETKLTAVPLPQPLVGPSVVAADDGSVWVGRFYHPLLAVRGGAVADAKGPADIACAYRDLEGGVWFGTQEALWHAPAGASPGSARFTRVPLPEQAGRGDVQAIARTPGGELWVSIRGGRMKGVFRRRGEAWSPVPLPAGFSNQLAMTAAADSAGRVWLGYGGSRLVRVENGSARVFTGRDGLRVGTVSALLVRGPRVWVGGEHGVARFEGGRFRSVRTREPLRGITGIVETAGADLWLHGVDGVTRIAAGEVGRALGDPAYRARVERFDHLDGLPGQAPQVRPLPSAIQGADGRLWFTTESGVAWIDPANIRRNRMPPPVQVRAVSAAGTQYDARGHVRLPARTTQLQIAYTALSFANPSRVRFRYRLSGVDTAWVEAGARREAYYTNLGPGKHSFRVIAANEDGVWNPAGARVDLEIPPTFTQTRAFLVLIALAVAGAVLLLALWRQRQLARTLRAQYEGQLAERTRGARELHDMLLGDMAGVAMQLSAGERRAEASGAGAPVVELLAGLGAQMQHAMKEARRSVSGMRSAPGALPPLHDRVAELAARTFSGTEIAPRVRHTGAPLPLAPEVEDEILGIAGEAMTNARKHAACRNVTVDCRYGARELSVCVRDDGRGFDTSRAAPSGHWGLVGMRERAASVGAALDLASAPAGGTEVTLTVRTGQERRSWRQRLRGFELFRSS